MRMAASILLIDMDAFFASVEQARRPNCAAAPWSSAAAPNSAAW